MSLKGKVALITGAGRDGKGIGQAICLVLASQGVKVYLADNDVSCLVRVQDALSAQSLSLNIVKMDVTDPERCSEVCRMIVQECSILDILVNNAGINSDQVVGRMSVEQWQKVLDINLTGAFNCTKAAIRAPITRNGGRIINIASVIGEIGNVGQANYSASKAGLIGLTKSVAKEMARSGVTVNAVAPGFIETSMTDQLPDKKKKEILQSIPLGYFGQSEDVAKMVVFLCTDDARYITGQVINVDGGMVM